MRHLKSPKQLLDFIRDLSIIELNNFKNCLIEDITDNSKNIKKNTLFVAIEGYKFDGHDFCQEAVSRGAKAIIGEKKIQLRQDIPYIRVKNSRKVLAELVKKLYKRSGNNLKLIGVTGSTGKTSTTMMIDNIINVIECKTGLMGSLYTKIGEKTYKNPDDCTTPHPTFINKKMEEMRQEGINYLSMEVSSHALKLDRVWNLGYDIGIFTNISYDHMKFHNSIKDYYKSKKKLFSLLNKKAIAIINKDDKFYFSLTKEVQNNHYSYAIYNKADISASNIKSSKAGIKFNLDINNQLRTLNHKVINPQTIKIKMPVLGRHNVYNALAACACGLGLGFGLDNIKEGLNNFTGVRRRMEIIYDSDDITIIDDFAHNPASLSANFNTLKNFNYNNLIIVNFLKGNRGVKVNEINARIIANWLEELNIKKIITTRSEEFVKSKNEILLKEEKAFTDIIKNNNI
jgi:UDP-N-acetylmuramoyl-L-alanyl-D-glutamate--2,6-diaminopimelate ligase